MFIRYILILSFLFAASPLALALNGKVIGVSDGDTLTVLSGLTKVKVRLAEIDAPEKDQAFGQKSKQKLSDLCFGKTATVTEDGKDRYGRVIGYVSCGGKQANMELIASGLAWFYVAYGKNQAYRTEETKARAGKIGLWQSGQIAIEPWRWRKGVRAGGTPDEIPAPLSGPFVKKSISGICHQSGTKYYEKTKNFTSYPTLNSCILSGGRTPKG